MPPSLDFAGVPLPRADVVTTTIFAGNGAPTASVSSPSSSQASLPIGAIVGGLLGGVFLALAAVGGWIWWGKILERQDRKETLLRSALKNGGQSTPSMGSRRSHHHHMASVSQKSVSFALVPSSGSSEDSISPIPSPDASTAVEERDKGRRTSASRTSPVRESGTPVASGSRTRTSVTPRSAMRPPSSQRSQSADRAYAPARPSPLAHATHVPLSPPPPAVDARPTSPPGKGLLSGAASSPDRLAGAGASSSPSRFQEGTAV